MALCKSLGALRVPSLRFFFTRFQTLISSDSDLMHDSSNLVHTLVVIQQPWVPSKHLCKTLKMKVIDAHNAGEGYKEIAKRCQLAVRNVIKRRQFRGPAEVKMRSGSMVTGRDATGLNSARFCCESVFRWIKIWRVSYLNRSWTKLTS